MTDRPRTEISYNDAFELAGRPHAGSFAPLVVTGAALGAAVPIASDYLTHGRVLWPITLPFIPFLGGCGVVIGGIAAWGWQERETRRRMATTHPELRVGPMNGPGVAR